MSDADSSERVTRAPPDAQALPSTWWTRYAENVAASGIPPVSRDVLEIDSRYIVERGVLGAGPAGHANWPDGRVRKGLVMGAVQSGKTASMLGVAAKSLDNEVDMIVVLAGTQVSLWRQSLRRLVQQLDGAGQGQPASAGQRRVLVPDLVMAMDDHGDRTPKRLYALSAPRLARAVALKRPVIAVVLKNVHHLRALTEVLRTNLDPAVAAAGRPFHLLVLDDEADDGSILDARIEAQLDPAFHDLKQIPRAIVDLWENRPHSAATTTPNLYATYVGYTATPQANFLQSDHNPLAPTDFIATLRTPWSDGDLNPRHTTYREAEGLAAYYTGGETFYRRLPAAALLRPASSNADEDLADAVRAFLVAGAIRTLRDPDCLPHSASRSESFSSRDQAAAASPPVHSMLVHPSAVIGDHFAAAARVMSAICGTDYATSLALIRAGHRTLPQDAIDRAVSANEDSWLTWLARYRSTARAIAEAFDLPKARELPEDKDWPMLRRLIVEELAPATEIRIINSDPQADERPRFEPVQQSDGSWVVAPDLSSIFVSGNVMSRGLTLEGLTTTLFIRRSNDPFADTQMQMQRWFGYRGSYVELCRVFAPTEQLDLLRAYHDTDEGLRRSVVAAMNLSNDTAPSPIVLQGPGFSATGKLANLANVPLCPGATPFIKTVNVDEPDPNIGLLARTFESAVSADVIVGGHIRGRILEEPLSLREAANLLDELRYTAFRPSADGWEAARWRDLEDKIGIDAGTDIENLLPLFRPPSSGGGSGQYTPGGPYAISAYFRAWAACLTRHARGLVGTENPKLPWSMLDLEAKVARQPKFYVGIRYGSGTEVLDGPLAGLPFRVTTMRRSASNGELTGAWGTRNPGAGSNQYLSDELFDYHHHGGTPPARVAGQPLWRPEGAPGQLLFHVVDVAETGARCVALGLAIPLGGPDQFAARVQGVPT